MSTPKVFVTGVTGYVGGDALYVITKAHPDWAYSFLVRDENRGKALKTWLPSARLVYGDLSKLELLEAESTAADIVLHFASSDDEPAAHAIVAGAAKSETPVYLIHTSGTGNLLWVDLNAKRFGEPGDKIWDDIADIDEIAHFSPEVTHAPVDQIALEARKSGPNAQPAVVCPPAIIGVGRGPVNQRSLQVPVLTELIRQQRRGFQVGAGKSAWSFVHVHDLSDVYLRLAEAAANGGQGAEWGDQAFYFTNNGDLTWSDVAHHIVAILAARDSSSLETTEIDISTPADIKQLMEIMLGTLGCNSLSRGSRTRHVLNWSPVLSDHYATIEEMVDFELNGKQSRLVDFAAGHVPGAKVKR